MQNLPVPSKLNRSAALLAVVAVTLLSAPAAQAGFKVSFPPPLAIDSNYPYFEPGPFNLSETVPVLGSGVWAGARYLEERSSRLPTGPGGSLVTSNEGADSGWITTSQPGNGVSAHASIDLSPWLGVVQPSSARTTLFQNHVYANSETKYKYTNSGNVDAGGITHAAGTLYKESLSRSFASSAWYDGWLATGQGQTDLTLKLDGQVFDRDVCAGCGVSFPPGTDSQRLAQLGISFAASLAVYDMDSVIPCGFGTSDWCGVPHAFPVHIVEVRYRAEAGDQFPLTLDQQVTVSFVPVLGHRYLAIGQVSAISTNGAKLDFYNTVGLTVNAPEGTLYSYGLGADLGAHFAQPVPEPGTLALWAGGLLGLLLRRQRTGA